MTKFDSLGSPEELRNGSYDSYSIHYGNSYGSIWVTNNLWYDTDQIWDTCIPKFVNKLSNHNVFCEHLQNLIRFIV